MINSCDAEGKARDEPVQSWLDDIEVLKQSKYKPLIKDERDNLQSNFKEISLSCNAWRVFANVEAYHFNGQKFRQWTVIGNFVMNQCI